MRFVAAAATALVALTGCGGGGSGIVNPPTQPPSETPSQTASPSATSTAGVEQHVTVTPSSGLSARQSVLVSGRGFTPGESLVVTQCAAKGQKTGAGDCNLSGLTSVTADGRGHVRLRFTVVKGPFGGNKIVCSRRQACLVSVTQATLSPTEEADAAISFR